MNSSIVRKPPPTRTKSDYKLTDDFILLDLDIHALSPKEINAFTLSEEHDLEALSVWEVIQEVSKSAIDDVIFYRHVHLHLFA